MICNLTQASTLLGYRSRSVLQRLVKTGHLRDYERGSQGRSVLLETEPTGLPSLREAVSSLTVVRIGSPLTRPAGRDWDAIAEECNAMLNPSLWGPPPWSADRWAGLAGVLEIAEEIAADGRERPVAVGFVTGAGRPIEPADGRRGASTQCTAPEVGTMDGRPLCNTPWRALVE